MSSSIAGELVTETFGYDGGRLVMSARHRAEVTGRLP
jgi:hypothetical protein